jgi:hypothetical protein
VPTVTTFTLQNLHCNRESSSVGSSPYIWPVRLWLDNNTIATADPVRTIGIPTGHERVVIKSGMRPGETAAIPFPFTTLPLGFESPADMRALVLVVALFGKDATPEHAIRRGSAAFASALDSQISDKWFELLGAIRGRDNVRLGEIIKAIKENVGTLVTSAISDDLSALEKLDPNQDQLKGVDYYFTDIAEPVSTTLSLSFSLDERVKIDPNYVGGTKWVPWSTVSEGSTTPGGWVTAAPWGQRFALFLADPNGGIYGTGGDPQGGFGPWGLVPGRNPGWTTPGGPVTAVPWGQRFALFVAGTDGRIYTTGGDPQADFGDWAWVPVRNPGWTTPGGLVTAVPWGQRFALFVAGTDGRIYTTGGDPQADFGDWVPIPGLSARPGSPVAAVPYGQGFALFVADLNGGIYATSSRFPDYTIDGVFDLRVA